MLRYVVLGILNYSPMNGYELKQFMDSSTAHFWHAKQSQVYMTLKALEGEGMVVSEVQVDPDRIDRRVYTITEAGRAALREWLAEPITEIEPSKDTVLVKLFFAAQLDKETILAHLVTQRALFQKLATSYADDTTARIEQTAAENPHLRRDAALWEATRRLGQMTAELYVRWLDETITSVKADFE